MPYSLVPTTIHSRCGWTAKAVGAPFVFARGTRDTCDSPEFCHSKAGPEKERLNRDSLVPTIPGSCSGRIWVIPGTSSQTNVPLYVVACTLPLVGRLHDRNARKVTSSADTHLINAVSCSISAFPQHLPVRSTRADKCHPQKVTQDKCTIPQFALREATRPTSTCRQRIPMLSFPGVATPRKESHSLTIVGLGPSDNEALCSFRQFIKTSTPLEEPIATISSVTLATLDTRLPQSKFHSRRTDEPSKESFQQDIR